MNTHLFDFDNTPTLAEMQREAAEDMPPDDEPDDCWTCRGTGEGRYDRGTCMACRGTGISRRIC